MENFNEQLEEVVEKKRRKAKLVNLLDEIRRHLRQQQERERHLRVKLELEGKDVEKLEELSLTGLFHTILGNKEQQLEKERQEFLAAKLKHQECLAEIADLEEKERQASEALSQLGEVEALYNRLMKEQEGNILSRQDQEAQTLAQLTEKVAEAQADLREVQEALQAGNQVMFEIKNMLEQLSSAQNWGVWDMVGGGMISTAIKHSKINDARESSHRVQRLLGTFQRELADVDGRLLNETEVGVDSFLTFADFFFDGLIADWVVQSKINRSKEQTEMLAGQVSRVIHRLEQTKRRLQNKVSELKKERQSVIEGRS